MGAAYGAGYAGDMPCVAPSAKLTAIEEAISHVEIMRQQLNLINGDVAAFLDRAGGGALNGADQEKCSNPPLPSGQLPRLGNNLRELKQLLNTLGERVSKLNQIA